MLQDGGLTSESLGNPLKDDVTIGAIRDGAHELVRIDVFDPLPRHLGVVVKVGSAGRGLDLLRSSSWSVNSSVRHGVKRKKRDDVGANFAVSHLPRRPIKSFSAVGGVAGARQRGSGRTRSGSSGLTALRGDRER